MITLTDTAADKVRQLITAEGDDALALRVAVRPGGCSGFSYEMFFDSDVATDDVTVEHLLAHRSGIGDYLDEDETADVRDYVMPVPVHRLATTEQYLPLLDGHEPVSPADARFAYNNADEGEHAIVTVDNYSLWVDPDNKSLIHWSWCADNFEQWLATQTQWLPKSDRERDAWNAKVEARSRKERR